MKVFIGGSDPQLSPLSRLLLRRMLCPLTGLCQEIGFVARSPLDPKIAVAGGDMAGVHILRGLPTPRPGAYHIGGSGTTFEEAIIGTLGETVERYAHHMAVASKRQEVLYASCREIQAKGYRMLMPESLQFFSEGQFAQREFPFSRLQPNTVIGWVTAQSLIDGADCWVPAQLVCVGYVRQPSEPQFMVGVTTGTAAHTRWDRAVRGALLELIQIDSAMGHWYSDRSAVPLRHDARTRTVRKVIERHLHPSGPSPRFYWLPNADLPGLAVACVIEDQDVPRFAVGLGCDLHLNRAMYKAFLEGVAVFQLAKIVLFRQTMEEVSPVADLMTVYDLDSNVAYYAAQGRDAVRAKFGDGPAINASDLPADVDHDVAGDIRYLVDGFKQTGKELVFLDLTTSDLRELGFYVVRLWSPDTISLPLPSAAPMMHPRFQAYGGFAYEAPHPYP